MESIEVKLRRLRGWFIACFAAQAFIGIVTSIGVLDRLRMFGLPSLDSDSVSFSVVISLFVLAVLLVLALWLFEALFQVRNWARIVLLVIAWLSAGGAVLSILGSGMLGFVGARFSGLDLGTLALVSLVSNGLKLALGAYVIATLQFDREVLKAFGCWESSAPSHG